MRQIIATALLMAGLALEPTVAAADEVISQRVRVSDLDLGSIEGQRTLVRRVNVAIDQVCTAASAVPVSKLRQRTVKRNCREQARDSVELQLAEHGLSSQLVASLR